MLESPSKLTWSPDWDLEEIREDPEKHEAWKEMMINRQEQGKILSFSPSTEMEKEEEEIEMHSESPSKKKSGTSNKRKGKKKKK
ncbi:unnamed protein product [Rhizophagus irregularis]|nr:unnamed protein product [Rhizophagus irregularis]